ncbi:MAG TPA: methyltransferase [Verrucomicrobiae bacterium]
MSEQALDCNYAEPVFKGWAKPGPVPPGALGGGPDLEPGETLDAISGFFRLFQLEKGHRFSTDDVLTAWFGTTCCPTAQTVLDLGSGVGAVGMIAMWRLPGARFVTVEAQAESVRLARKSVRWNGIEDRYEIRHGDFRDPAVLRVDEKFDLILGSPPYFPPGSGVTGDHPQKVACRFEMLGDIADYCAVAAPRLNRGGTFSCVFPVTPEAQQKRVEGAAAAAGLCIIRWRPMVLREPDPPLLGLFCMTSASDLPETVQKRPWVDPPLIIRTSAGTIHPEYSVIKLSFGFPP